MSVSILIGGGERRMKAFYLFLGVVIFGLSCQQLSLANTSFDSVGEASILVGKTSIFESNNFEKTIIKLEKSIQNKMIPILIKSNSKHLSVSERLFPIAKYSIENTFEFQSN